MTDKVNSFWLSAMIGDSTLPLVKFFQLLGLLAEVVKCSVCREEMRLIKVPASLTRDGYMWRCRKDNRSREVFNCNLDFLGVCFVVGFSVVVVKVLRFIVWYR